MTFPTSMANDLNLLNQRNKVHPAMSGRSIVFAQKYAEILPRMESSSYVEVFENGGNPKSSKFNMGLGSHLNVVVIIIIIIIIIIIWLVVWTPLKNISQLGWLFPIYGKIKNVPNRQPVNVIIIIIIIIIINNITRPSTQAQTASVKRLLRSNGMSFGASLGHTQARPTTPSNGSRWGQRDAGAIGDVGG